MTGLLITSGGTIQERIDRQLPIWGIDLDDDGLLGSNGVYGAATTNPRSRRTSPAYQNELLISAEAPNAVNLSVGSALMSLIRSVKHLLTKSGTRSTKTLIPGGTIWFGSTVMATTASLCRSPTAP